MTNPKGYEFIPVGEEFPRWEWMVSGVYKYPVCGRREESVLYGELLFRLSKEPGVRIDQEELPSNGGWTTPGMKYRVWVVDEYFQPPVVGAVVGRRVLSGGDGAWFDTHGLSWCFTRAEILLQCKRGLYDKLFKHQLDLSNYRGALNPFRGGVCIKFQAMEEVDWHHFIDACGYKVAFARVYNDPTTWRLVNQPGFANLTVGEVQILAAKAQLNPSETAPDLHYGLVLYPAALPYLERGTIKRYQPHPKATASIGGAKVFKDPVIERIPSWVYDILRDKYVLDIEPPKVLSSGKPMPKLKPKSKSSNK